MVCPFMGRPCPEKRPQKKLGRNFGAGDRIRTGDINLGKVALYQLSYSRLDSLQLEVNAAFHIVAPRLVKSQI
jgi:hypothetical protein